MKREQAIRKVLACLRLAKSSNPHEAAAALRQARKMMETFGITETDAVAAEYAQHQTKPCGRGRSIPPSTIALVNLVAQGFRCESHLSIELRPSWTGYEHRSISVVFFGRGADATIAAYAFDVLFRQLSRDRLHHIGRVRKRANREARGEAFAQGWVHAVADLFPAAEMSPDEVHALVCTRNAMFPTLKDVKAREMGAGGRTKDDDWWNGHQKGKRARLHSGVAGAGQRRLGVS